MKKEKYIKSVNRYEKIMIVFSLLTFIFSFIIIPFFKDKKNGFIIIIVIYSLLIICDLILIIVAKLLDNKKFDFKDKFLPGYISSKTRMSYIFLFLSVFYCIFIVSGFIYCLLKYFL